MTEKQWWEPELCDSQYFERLRLDYPDKAHLSNEDLHEHFNNSLKYSITWDHIGDAYDEYENLADAYLELKGDSSTNVPEQNWISVKEAMPDTKEPVLYLRRTSNKNYIGIAYWTVSKKWNPEAESEHNPIGFTHWAPLPPLPTN